MSERSNRRRRRQAAEPWVTNAANPAQTKAAGKVERRQRDLELGDLAMVLATPEGRRTLWRVLIQCRVHETVYPVNLLEGENPTLRLAYNSGRQDLGHFLEAEIVEADEEGLFRMMREAKARAQAEADELESERTTSADPAKAATETETET